MNPLILITIALSAHMVSAYDEKYNELNLQDLLTDEGAKTFMTCFMDENSCDGELLIPKEMVIEIMRTDCAKCSPEQRQLVERFKMFASEKYPDLFGKFVASIASSIVND